MNSWCKIVRGKINTNGFNIWCMVITIHHFIIKTNSIKLMMTSSTLLIPEVMPFDLYITVLIYGSGCSDSKCHAMLGNSEQENQPQDTVRNNSKDPFTRDINDTDNVETSYTKHGNQWSTSIKCVFMIAAFVTVHFVKNY